MTETSLASQTDEERLTSVLQRTSAEIVTHIFVTGPAHELAGYLGTKVKHLLFIGFPFYYSDRSSGEVKLLSNGRMIQAREFPYLSPRKFGVVSHFLDVPLTIWLNLRFRTRVNLYFGVDTISAFAGLFLRRFGLVNRVILYTADSPAIRFRNPVLQGLYLLLDKICSKDVDCIWNLSPQMQKLREKRGLRHDEIAPQVVVPMGAHVSRIKPPPAVDVERNSLVYLGSLRAGQGIEVLIEAFSIACKRIPHLKLVLIGTGPLESWVKSETRKRGLGNRITIHGYVESHEEVERIIAKCGVGIAVYDPNPLRAIRFTDVGKVKVYLACGLPVIATPVSEFLAEVARSGAGLLVDYDPSVVANAIEQILGNASVWEEYRKSSLLLAGTFDWEKVFSQALSSTLEL